MIFAYVRAGVYVILEEHAVVATVERETCWDRYSTKYPTTWYRVEWLGFPDRTERFRTIADIQDKYFFVNYGGYNNVLKRKK